MDFRKIKKLFLSVCILVFAVLCTGCGAKTNSTIKVRSSSTADYSFSVGLDDEMVRAFASTANVSKKELISEFKSEGAKYAVKKENGVTYHVFTFSKKKAKFSEIEKVLESMGYTNVCIKKDYFFATYNAGDKSAGNNSAIATDDFLKEISKETGMDTSNFHYYQTFSIQLNGNIKRTNGKINKNNKKCVTWTYKNYNKSKNFYASTSSVKKRATVKNIKNGKKYKLGKKGYILKIANASNAARITLNGKKVKNGTAIKKSGRYTLTIWSKNGQCRTVKFDIVK